MKRSWQAGYEPEGPNTALELTYNWDTQDYEKGGAFGHIALAVDDLEAIYGSIVLEGAGFFGHWGS